MMVKWSLLKVLLQTVDNSLRRLLTLSTDGYFQEGINISAFLSSCTIALEVTSDGMETPISSMKLFWTTQTFSFDFLFWVSTVSFLRFFRNSCAPFFLVLFSFFLFSLFFLYVELFGFKTISVSYCRDSRGWFFWCAENLRYTCKCLARTKLLSHSEEQSEALNRSKAFSCFLQLIRLRLVVG